MQRRIRTYILTKHKNTTNRETLRDTTLYIPCIPEVSYLAGFQRVMRRVHGGAPRGLARCVQGAAVISSCAERSRPSMGQRYTRWCSSFFRARRHVRYVIHVRRATAWMPSRYHARQNDTVLILGAGSDWVWSHHVVASLTIKGRIIALCIGVRVTQGDDSWLSPGGGCIYRHYYGFHQLLIWNMFNFWPDIF